MIDSIELPKFKRINLLHASHSQIDSSKFTKPFYFVFNLFKLFSPLRWTNLLLRSSILFYLIENNTTKIDNNLEQRISKPSFVQWMFPFDSTMSTCRFMLFPNLSLSYFSITHYANAASSIKLDKLISLKMNRKRQQQQQTMSCIKRCKHSSKSLGGRVH